MDQPHVIVLFGATGDLSRRKLLPGMLHLFQAGLLTDARIIGTSLDDYDDEQFHKVVREACEEFSGPSIDRRWDELDRKSTRLNSSHANISYAAFCLKKKKINLSAYTLS